MGLGGLPPRELARRVWREARRDQLTERAAGLSYYFLLAIFPALLFLTALLGLVPEPRLAERLLDALDRVLPPDAASLLRRTFHEIVSGARGSLVSIGVLGALWAASKGMLSVMAALNAAYGVEERRRWWRRRLLSVELTLALSLLAAGALLLLVLGERLGDWIAARARLGPAFEAAWDVLRWTAGASLALAGIALVYGRGPSEGRRRAWITPGAVFALGSWLAMSLGLRAYALHFARTNKIYGSIAGVIFLMLWLYLSGLALLIGAEIDSEIERGRPPRRVR